MLMSNPLSVGTLSAASLKKPFYEQQCQQNRVLYVITFKPENSTALFHKVRTHII
jgi:hypothetical protein